MKQTDGSFGVKLKNKRVIFEYTQDKNGNLGLLIHTRRLIDFKTREIQQTNVLYGMETLILVKQFLDFFFDKKINLFNREYSQVEEYLRKNAI
jgi:hypothetical protein